MNSGIYEVLILNKYKNKDIVRLFMTILTMGSLPNDNGSPPDESAGGLHIFPDNEVIYKYIEYLDPKEVHENVLPPFREKFITPELSNIINFELFKENSAQDFIIWYFLNRELTKKLSGKMLAEIIKRVFTRLEFSSDQAKNVALLYNKNDIWEAIIEMYFKEKTTKK